MCETSRAAEDRNPFFELARDSSVGSIVVVRNAGGTQVSALIVSQLAASPGLSVYAIEFAEQDHEARRASWFSWCPFGVQTAEFHKESWESERLTRQTELFCEESLAS